MTVDEGAGDVDARIDELHHKLDTIAGAMAAVAASQQDLLTQGADVDGRRSQDALDVAQRLEALERQVLQLVTQASATASEGAPAGEGANDSIAEVLATTTAQREDLTLALEVLAGVAATVEKSEARAEDRLAAIRDAASVPIADLQALLTARTERTDHAIEGLLDRVNAVVAALEVPAPPPEGPTAVERVADQLGQRVDDLQSTVQSLSWQLPEVTQAIAALETQVEALDLAGPVASATEELGGQLTQHTDTALAGAIRLIDERLKGLRGVIEEAGERTGANQSNMGFEAGAVMGAAQAAWNRLEQRLDAEFDDLGRQLHAMGALIEQALATAEAAANRPVVTGEQLRHTATSIKDAVMNASRSRRQRRGGTRELPPGAGG